MGNSLSLPPPSTSAYRAESPHEPVVLRLLKLGFYLVVGILTSRMGYPGWRFLGPGPQQYEEPLLRP